MCLDGRLPGKTAQSCQPAKPHDNPCATASACWQASSALTCGGRNWKPFLPPTNQQSLRRPPRHGWPWTQAIYKSHVQTAPSKSSHAHAKSWLQSTHQQRVEEPTMQYQAPYIACTQAQRQAPYPAMPRSMDSPKGRAAAGRASHKALLHCRANIGSSYWQRSIVVSTTVRQSPVQESEAVVPTPTATPTAETAVRMDSSARAQHA